MSRPARLSLLIIVIIGLAVAVALLPPIPQDPAYHHFADQRSFLGVPNAADVGSNLFILAAGLTGLARLWRGGRDSCFIVPGCGVHVRFLPTEWSEDEQNHGLAVASELLERRGVA